VSILAAAGIAVTLLGVLGMLPAGSVAHAQVEATQAFTVRVPPKLTVTPPSSTITIPHDGTPRNRASTTQRWHVNANSLFGATVAFSTDRAFANAANARLKGDAQLDLAVVRSEGLAKWAVTVASDRTHLRGSRRDERATVRAASERPGSGTFDIRVTFLADPQVSLEPGDYAVTVVGTLTAN